MTKRNFSRLQPAVDRRYAEQIDERDPALIDSLLQELADGATPDELGSWLRDEYGMVDYEIKQMVAAARHLRRMR